MSMDATIKTIKFGYQPVPSNTYSINKIYNLPVTTTEVVCPYCNKNESLISQDGICVYIFSDQLISFVHNKDGEISIFGTSINYCPICGRKINEESAWKNQAN